MNIGMIILDKIGLELPEFKVSNGKITNFNNNPHFPQNGIGDFLIRDDWNFLFLGEEGYYFHKGTKINKHLDTIFVVSDRQFNPIDIKQLRNIYPNTQLFGYVKEMSPQIHMPEYRIKFLQSCDKIVIKWRHEVCNLVEQATNKKVYHLPWAYNIDKIRELFFKPWQERENKILSWVNERRGLNNQADNYTFAHLLGQKFNYEVVFKDLNIESLLRDWLELLSQFKFIVNVDAGFGGGQVPIESAILEVIPLGGLTDSAVCLWPQFAIIDKSRLEFEFYFLAHDPGLQEKTRKEAFERLVNRHSFGIVKTKLEQILND